MTAHTHSHHVLGCYRCDLSRDEELDAVIETVAESIEWETFRSSQGWPTPNSMRKAADALDTLSPPKYGAILRFVADLCDKADKATR